MRLPFISMKLKLRFLIHTLLCLVAISANASCNNTLEKDNQAEDTSSTDTVSGVVELLYMGQSSIRIVTEQGKVIYIDPYA